VQVAVRLFFERDTEGIGVERSARASISDDWTETGYEEDPDILWVLHRVSSVRSVDEDMEAGCRLTPKFSCKGIQ
jgi:hypothetical protein